MEDFEVKLENLKTIENLNNIKGIFDVLSTGILESDFMVSGEIKNILDVEKMLRNDNILNFVAYYKNIPVGICQIFNNKNSYEFSSNFKIKALLVTPSFRGKGMGDLLLKSALQYMQEHKDSGVIFLDVVSQNAAAKKLYENNGFIKTGNLSNAYKKNDVLYDIEIYSISF